MGIHFAIDRRERLVSYVVEGAATQAEAHAFFDAVLAHPEYRCGFDFFGDRRDVSATPDSNYVYAVAAEVLARARVLGPCRWAVVVSDDAAECRARTWAALAAASGVQIRAFRTAGAAADWLGLPATYAPLARLPAPQSAGPPVHVPVGTEATCGAQEPTVADAHIPLVGCPAGAVQSSG